MFIVEEYLLDLGFATAKTRLARCRDLVSRDGSAVLALRWEATGLAGSIFPVLDADITLTPAGEHGTRLSLAGAYRQPRPTSLTTSVEDGALRGVTAATVRSLLARIASALAPTADAAGPDQ